ncbi:MAG: T9SS type A sorting domain-containing protein [Candidatus Zixiibacteriota bacterium]
MKRIAGLVFILAISMFALDVYDIQYTDDPSGDSPYLDETVEVNGVIIATNFRGDKYFIGDEEGGPWTGVYVYDYEHEVALGDLVTLTAVVDEYYNLTELKEVSAFSIDGSADVPEPYLTTTADISEMESLEGVLVRVEDVEVVRNDTTGVWISDGSGECKFGFNFDHTYSPTVGDELEFINGVIDYSWGNYVLQPRFDEDIDMPEAEMTTIYDIQYSDDGPSPLEGSVVTIHAICTANNYSGSNYFLTDVHDSGPWHGIYVYDSEHAPEVGDYVTLTAEVDEYYDYTELKNVASFTVDSSGADIDVYETDMEGAAQESMEGVLVKVDEVLIVDSIREYDWLVTNGTSTMPVMSHFDYTYEPTVGDTFASITGFVFYSYEEYKLEPRSDDDFESMEMVKEDTPMPDMINITAYPNPFNSSCNINAPLNSRISVIDNSGKKVEAKIANSTIKFRDDTDSGIYFIRIESDDKVYHERVLYIK